MLLSKRVKNGVCLRKVYWTNCTCQTSKVCKNAYFRHLFFNVYFSLIISKKAFLILEGIMHAFASHTIPKGHILSKNPFLSYIFEALKTVENH